MITLKIYKQCNIFYNITFFRGGGDIDKETHLLINSYP